MTAIDPPTCDIPGEHEGPPRLYAAGWRCSRHSPWRERGLPEPAPGLPPKEAP